MLVLLLLSSSLLDSMLRNDGTDGDTVDAAMSVFVAVSIDVVGDAGVLWLLVWLQFVHVSLHMLLLLVLM